jgi:hypothetical protein
LAEIFLRKRSKDFCETEGYSREDLNVEFEKAIEQKLQNIHVQKNHEFSLFYEQLYRPKKENDEKPFSFSSKGKELRRVTLWVTLWVRRRRNFF